MGDLGKLFDSYNRVARIYPALITLAPLLWSSVIFLRTPLPDFSKGAAAVGALCCLLYLFASLARSRGKSVEERLLAKWGTWPTTIFLRHHDGTIDPITKARYHAALSKLCDGIRFPTFEEERVSPETADSVYRSATKRLIEATRGLQYRMVHEENASYGFRRNLLGLKPIAIALAVAAGVLTSLTWWVAMPTAFTWPAILSSGKENPGLPALLALDISYVLLLAFVVQPAFVFQAACEYAAAILRTLDLPVTTSTARAVRSRRKSEAPPKQ